MNMFSWLFLLFLTLKLCGVIAWSWWWVTLPIWGWFALAGILYTFAGVLGVVVDWGRDGEP